MVEWVVVFSRPKSGNGYSGVYFQFVHVHCEYHLPRSLESPKPSYPWIHFVSVKDNRSSSIGNIRHIQNERRVLLCLVSKHFIHWKLSFKRFLKKCYNLQTSLLFHLPGQALVLLLVHSSFQAEVGLMVVQEKLHWINSSRPNERTPQTGIDCVSFLHSRSIDCLSFQFSPVYWKLRVQSETKKFRLVIHYACKTNTEYVTRKFMKL